MNWRNFLPRFTRGEKASAANRVIVMGLGLSGHPVDHPNFERLAKEAFERNVAVFACINEIMKAGSVVPWLLNERQRTAGPPKRIMTGRTFTKGWTRTCPQQGRLRKALEQTEVEDHPLLTLLERPNKRQGQADYLRQLIGYFLISGNSFEEFVALNDAKKLPVEMHNLRPDRVKVIPNTPEARRRYAELAKEVDALELILGYSYQAGSREMIFPERSILHGKAFHATDDFYGLSPLAAAARAYRTDNLAADWNFALIKNEARPSGTLIAPQVVNTETYERMKKEIDESYSGIEGAGRPIFLEGGLEWTQLGLSPLELDWLAGRKYSRVEICAVYNVPPELIGDAEHKTYNSFPEARASFYFEAVLPLLDRIRDAYNTHLVPLFGENLFLDYDRDQIDAIQEDQAKLWLRVGRAAHISVNEKRLATGYDTYEGDPETDHPADVPLELLTGKTPPELDPNADPNADPAEEENEDAKEENEKKAARLREQRLAEATVLRFKRMMATHFRRQGKHFRSALRNALGR